MSANVEAMFYVREKPWHGLGTAVQEAPTSADALICAGLDWEVVQKAVYTEYGSIIPGYKANTRSTDEAILAGLMAEERGTGIFFSVIRLAVIRRCAP